MELNDTALATIIAKTISSFAFNCIASKNEIAKNTSKS